MNPCPATGTGATVRVTLPLISAVSKNQSHRLARGRIVNTPAAVKWALLAKAKIREAARGHKWAPRCKTWLEILVVMPHHRADAINVLDLMADTVASAIGVNDRWFAIRSLDWALAPGQAGWIELGISQGDDPVDRADDPAVGSGTGPSTRGTESRLTR